MKSEELTERLLKAAITDRIREMTSLFPGKVIFTTSFGLEDQVISHIIFSNSLPVKVITLDTGRLFPETYKTFNETLKRYNPVINVYFPDRKKIESMVSEKGPFSFYYSVENRKECCHIRKVIPLNRALKGYSVWISGIRAEQSAERGRMKMVEFDDEKKLFKFYPLFDWNFEKVRQFIKTNNIPYNILHDRGFVSIGCEPCTRAVEKNEDFRSGRWWWEKGSDKECGLHK